ncbi:MAG: hypothetical protein HQK65_07510 [Desulfamplus sp.]|nr:hypothetical protein [Desulfamplus sp.]
MALPIGETPILRGRDAVEFMKRLEADLKRPAYLTPTPKIENARALIRAYAEKLKKQK